MHSTVAHKLLAGALLLSSAAPAHAEPQTRVSEEPQDAPAAWASSGFRLQLTGDGARIFAAGEAPALWTAGLTVEPGFRLNRQVSLGLGLHYGVLAGSYSGLRWSVTVDGSWHLHRAAVLSMGAGYAGILADRKAAKTSPTSTVRDHCDGGGAVSLLRLGYLFATGEVFASGPVAQADLQITRCTSSRFDVAAARKVQSVRWWWQPSVHLSWAFIWR